MAKKKETVKQPEQNCTEKKTYRKAITLPNGTRKYLSAKTQQELDDKIMELEVLNFGGVNICSQETFGHFAQMWFDLYKKPYLRETSLDGIRFVMNQYILPVLGNYKLRNISPMQIQALMVGLADKSYSVQSKVLIHLRSIFRVAEENGLVLRTPVSSMLKAGGKKPDEKIALTPEESRQLLSGIRNIRAKTLVLLGLHTGMRRGEMVALRWKDIDFRKGVIHVTRNAAMRRYETTIQDELKTKAGRRDIPLTEELSQWLRERKKYSHCQYVVATKDNKPLTISAYSSIWDCVERALPSRKVTTHILRHTYITRLFEAGLDIKEIQYLAGHSSVDMTLRVYTHYDRVSREEETREKVRAAFQREKEAVDAREKAAKEKPPASSGQRKRRAEK